MFSIQTCYYLAVRQVFCLSSHSPCTDIHIASYYLMPFTVTFLLFKKSKRGHHELKFLFSFLSNKFRLLNFYWKIRSEKYLLQLQIFAIVPFVADTVGISMTFVTYAVACILGIGFIIQIVPETKGRTLEEINTSISTM